MAARKAPHAFKQNFWSKIRVEKGVTIREVAELIGCGEKRTGMFFSGQIMPNEQVIKDICTLFDVDYNQGDLEFQAAHRNWRAEHHFSEAITCKRHKKAAPVEDVSVTNKGAEPQAVDASNPSDMISIDEVKRMFANRWVYAQRALYGVVDCGTYETIRALFEVNL